jgi:nitrogen regulatory protein P-II 1
MKKVEAIIRESRFEDVKKALCKAGIEWLSYWDMTRLGKSTRDQIVRGQVFHSNYLQRHMLCIVVRDENQDIAVDAIMAARTGKRVMGISSSLRSKEPGASARAKRVRKPFSSKGSSVNQSDLKTG